ncbi:MAG: substrate-binding domain-containing protein [Spirochaetales bacterium]|nr:substrate-binding domain-containing protein [Spirochaetales bacterium]
MNSSRTIGFLVDWLEDEYQNTILEGMAAAIKEHNSRLICFEGGVIESQLTFEIQRNFIYDWATPSNVDGLIVLSNSLFRETNVDRITSFCSQFHPLPLVSLTVDLEGIPSLLIDNKYGMKALVEHLVEIHGFRKFAYIDGPEKNRDAEERRAVFFDTLAIHDIIPEKKSIIQGDFREESGYRAICELFEVRKVDVEAIVAANDNMAIGALDKLSKLGKNVPWEIALTGFDDLQGSKWSCTPLTTVNQSLYEQGAKAVEMLIDMIDGKEVPDKIMIPTTLVIRESCSCFNRSVIDFSTIPHAGHTIPHAAGIKKERGKIKKYIMQAVEKAATTESPVIPDAVIDNLLDAFERWITANSDKKTLKVWNSSLVEIFKKGGTVMLCHLLLSVVREALLPYFMKGDSLHLIENVFHQMRILIVNHAVFFEKKKYYESHEENSTINRFRDEIILSLSEEQLMEMILERLPGLGIKSCYLVRFLETEGDNEKNSRLVFAYTGDKSLDLDNGQSLFPSHLLLPPQIFAQKDNHVMIIEALWHFDQMGYIIFEPGPLSTNIYGILRRIISSALQGMILYEQVKRQKNHLLSESEHLNKSLEELRKIIRAFVETIRRSVEARDPYTAHHHEQVADLARAIATEMGLSKEIIEGIRVAASVHDLGKIYVPAEILNKPGKLRDIEFNLIKVHPQVAYEILQPIDFPWPVAEIVLQHHERLDGSGYPHGLTGKDIILEARIISVADVVVAMASHRPYRSALGLETALEEIKRYAGVLYDKDVVAACLTLFIEKHYLLPQ